MVDPQKQGVVGHKDASPSSSVTSFVATLKSDDGWVLPRHQQPVQRDKVKRFLKAVGRVLDREYHHKGSSAKSDFSRIPDLKSKPQQRERLNPLLITQIKTRIEELKARAAMLDDSQKATQIRQRIVALQAMIKGY